MSHTISLIQSARIASPCDIKWDDMAGDDRMRYCSKCELNVYNFRAMSELEANALLEKSDGRICGQLWRRKDGTIITRDCPVGLAAVRWKIYMGFAKIAAAVIVIFTAAASGRSGDQDDNSPWRTAYARTTARISEWLNGPVQMLGGVMAPTLRTPANPVTGTTLSETSGE